MLLEVRSTYTKMKKNEEEKRKKDTHLYSSSHSFTAGLQYNITFIVLDKGERMLIVAEEGPFYFLFLFYPQLRTFFHSFSRERARERQKHRLVAFCTHPDQGSFIQEGGSNPQPFS